MITTEIGYSTSSTITVRGHDLANEILGKLDFVEMISLLVLKRLPSEEEKKMVNLILVTAADHGLTPSAMSARLTYLGAPEAMQGAVAAGLLGAGSVYLGTTQNAAEMLIGAAKSLASSATEADITEVALELVRQHRAKKRPILGVGHPIHVNGDPRVAVLREQAKANGFYGIHWRVMDAIADVIQREFGRTLPLNAVGAVAAIIADMGFDPLLGRGMMLMGRCAGLIAHVLEERESPIGAKLWDLVLEQDPRNKAP